MKQIYDRVCTWNSRRYDRVHDTQLTVSLLREELKEYHEAIEDVHQLDALCDLVYVALGAVWKLDLDNKVMHEDQVTSAEITVDLVEANVLEPVFFISSFIDAIEHEVDMPESLALNVIVNLALVQMQMLGLNLEQCYEALLIVCDSNDSKSVQKTDPTVKANVDKGALFVAPEPRLQSLLERANG